MLKKLNANFLWVFFFIFLGVAFFTHQGEAPIFSHGQFAMGKLAVWVIWLAFLLYTLNVNRQENFFKSVQRMWPILWFRQISLDLYLGLLIPLTLVYLHTGSLLVTLLWLVPILIFANLATLVYLALNFESIMALLLLDF